MAVDSIPRYKRLHDFASQRAMGMGFKIVLHFQAQPQYGTDPSLEAEGILDWTLPPLYMESASPDERDIDCVFVPGVDLPLFCVAEQVMAVG